MVHTIVSTIQKMVSAIQSKSVCWESITATTPTELVQHSLHGGNIYPDRIFTTVEISDDHDHGLREDPGAVKHVLTTKDLSIYNLH